MNKAKLLAILGYLNIGLAVAHNAGVTAGHFGQTDFLTLADEVNGLLISSLAPPAPATALIPAATGSSTTVAAN